MKVTDEMVEAARSMLWELWEHRVSKDHMRAAIEAAIGAAEIVMLGTMTASERGKLGGAARAAKLTPKRRAQIARKAAKARWSKNA